MKQKLEMISISDIHLGHHNVPTEFIIDNLNKALPDNETMANIDIIWFAGDIFDQLLDFSEDIIDNIQLWMVRILRLCSKWDITLRILEGTPSHDRTQSKHFIRLANDFNIPVDVKYIDKMVIEYMEKFDIHVLYIPDEYHSTTAETWNVTQELLRINGIEKVDYAIMHGMFNHQMITGLKLPFHESQNYLSIVKKYIFIGHVHRMSVYERILAQGSFDRLSQGEEEAKGFWKVTSYRDSFDSDKLEFVINEGAKIFKTLNFIGLEREMIDKLINEIKDFPNGSFIRVVINKDEKLLGLFDSLRKQYPFFRWSSQIVKEKGSVDVSIKLTTYQPTPINFNTIDSIVKDRLQYLNIDLMQQERIMSQLQKIK